MTRALIVVDVQNDFVEGGSLGVNGGEKVAQDITAMTRVIEQPYRQHYSRVVATKDWHINPGGHFSETPNYFDTWPAHCVAGTWGAEFHPNLQRVRFDAVFYKGLTTPSYSGFDGFTLSELPSKFELLNDYLARYRIEDVDICGIAADWCVKATALDSAGNGFNTRVWWDLCAGVDPETTQEARVAMESVGIAIVNARDSREFPIEVTQEKPSADS